MIVSTNFASVRPGDYVIDPRTGKSHVIVSKAGTFAAVTLKLTYGVVLEGRGDDLINVPVSQEA